MNTFAGAFAGKESKLSEKLQVTTGLLNKLLDREILRQEYIEDINESKGYTERATKLLAVLKRSDDARFDSFCEVLVEDKQEHVLSILECDCELLRDELVEIIEPDYGLVTKVYSEQIITFPQCEKILSKETVCERVACMLQRVKANIKDIQSKQFLDVLRSDNQGHVSNFIASNGRFSDGFKDNWPLNKQQRRRFLTAGPILSLNARIQMLPDLLRQYEILSDDQIESVVIERNTRLESTNKLLALLRRRSLRDAKNFIVCLLKCGYQQIVEQLTDSGAIASIRTVIEDFSLTDVEDQLMIERVVAERSIQLSTVEQCDRLRESGIIIFHIETRNSLVWYVKCPTLVALKTLKEIYDSGELCQNLQTIFNYLSGDDADRKLTVTWCDEDYENCLSSFKSQNFFLPFEVYLYLYLSI